MPVGLIWSLNANFSDLDRRMGTGTQPVGQSCTPSGFQIVTIAGNEYEDGIPFYLYGKENYVHVRGDDGDLLHVEFAEVTFHYDAPPKVEFELSETASEAERKVLIHKFRDEDTYPSSAQQRLASTAEGGDRRIEIKGNRSGRRRSCAGQDDLFPAARSCRSCAVRTGREARSGRQSRGRTVRENCAGRHAATRAGDVRRL